MSQEHPLVSTNKMSSSTEFLPLKKRATLPFNSKANNLYNSGPVSTKDDSFINPEVAAQVVKQHLLPMFAKRHSSTKTSIPTKERRGSVIQSTGPDKEFCPQNRTV